MFVHGDRAAIGPKVTRSSAAVALPGAVDTHSSFCFCCAGALSRVRRRAPAVLSSASRRERPALKGEGVHGMNGNELFFLDLVSLLSKVPGSHPFGMEGIPPRRYNLRTLSAYPTLPA